LNSFENDDPKKLSYMPTYDVKRKFYFLAVAVQEDARATRSLVLVLSLQTARDYSNPGPTAVFSFTCPHAQNTGSFHTNRSTRTFFCQ
jgi:hypothetical protein